MIEQELTKLLETVKIKHKIDLKNKEQENWFNGSETFFKEIKNEIKEAEIEYNNNKQVHLEDELGDILWDYLNLLINLKTENKITSIEKIFQRSNIKFSQRLNAIQNNIPWNEIKQQQKEKLKVEQENLNKINK